MIRDNRSLNALNSQIFYIKLTMYTFTTFTHDAILTPRLHVVLTLTHRTCRVLFEVTSMNERKSHDRRR